MQTLLHSLDESATESQLHNAAVNAPNGQIVIFGVFYLFAIFMLARRTGVRRAKRWVLVGVGVLFMVVYLAAGLTITGAEWDVLYPQLQQLSAAAH
jgi:cell division protein FtsW (lipid II flippase)